jgi:CspA family cold shock protein
MAKATVKWFSTDKGYGFLMPDDGGADAFVHIRDVQKAGISKLVEGQRVEYDLLPSRNGKDSAQNIKLI